LAVSSGWRSDDENAEPREGRRVFALARANGVISSMETGNDIDRATTARYHEVRNSPQNKRFIESIEGPADLPVAAEVNPRIVVMPGAFHREYPFTGADGQRVFELAEEIGWPAERIEVPSLASMERNATALIERLQGIQTTKSVVLVSLSKGGADVRAALARPGAAEVFRNVRAWINLSGIVTGTPLVAWLKARPLRCLGVRLLLRFRGQRFSDIEEIRHGPGAPLGGPMVLPTSLKAIHVIGFPLIKDLTNDLARRGHARLAPLGPNDGGGILLRDIARLPGLIYPVWGADHYLNPAGRNIRPLLLRILQAGAVPAD